MTEYCRLARIYGRVQGVNFRHSTRKEALRLGIRGWVCNMPDGSVEACICGSLAQLEAMRQWLSRGPSWASVERADFAEMAVSETLSDFEIRS